MGRFLIVGRVALPTPISRDDHPAIAEGPTIKLPLSLRTSAHTGVAIRNPCGALHRPVPLGPEKNGLPRRLAAPRNDVVIW